VAATAFEVGKLLKLDKSAARRRLLVAMEKGECGAGVQ
jgi:hypothetical protein